MISIAVPLEFVLARSTLSWREVSKAIESGWLHPREAIEFANRRLAASVASTPWELDLAGRRDDEPVLDTVRLLAESEPPENDKETTLKWMRLLLLWVYHRRGQLEDPLAAVEDVWCAFDHPVELNRFIRFMPAEDPVATKKRSTQENLAVIQTQWEEYMSDIDKAMTIPARRPEV